MGINTQGLSKTIKRLAMEILNHHLLVNFTKDQSQTLIEMGLAYLPSQMAINMRVTSKTIKCKETGLTNGSKEGNTKACGLKIRCTEKDCFLLMMESLRPYS